jgi:guanine nucleotide-binding protein subunit alpha, other
MIDAMSTFDSITSNRYFGSTSFMLFLNKWDLFEDKIASVDIRSTFPDYDGPSKDPHEGVKYFQNRFLRLARKTGDPERGLYPYVTTATNRKLLAAVMKIVEE